MLISEKHGLTPLSQVNSILCPPPVFRAALLYRSGGCCGTCACGTVLDITLARRRASLGCLLVFCEMHYRIHPKPSSTKAGTSTALLQFKTTSTDSFTRCLYFRKKELKHFRFPIRRITKIPTTKSPGVTQQHCTSAPRDTCVQYNFHK